MPKRDGIRERGEAAVSSQELPELDNDEGRKADAVSYPELPNNGKNEEM